MPRPPLGNRDNDDNEDKAGQEPEGETYTVTYKGEEIEVPLEELKKGYTRQKDHTKKTQEAAELKKEAEEQMKKVKAREEKLKSLSGPDTGLGSEDSQTFGALSGGDSDEQPARTPGRDFSLDIDDDGFVEASDVKKLLGQFAQMQKRQAQNMEQLQQQQKELYKERRENERIEALLDNYPDLDISECDDKFLELPDDEQQKLEDLPRDVAYRLIYLEHIKGESSEEESRPELPHMEGQRRTPSASKEAPEKLTGSDARDKKQLSAFVDQFKRSKGLRE